MLFSDWYKALINYFPLSLGVSHNYYSFSLHAHSIRNSFSGLNHEKIVGLLEIRPTDVRGPTETMCPQDFLIL